jgi:CheY-like chemotaxis protein
MPRCALRGGSALIHIREKLMALITVVNDDTAFLRLMHQLLKSHGYDVLLHREGARAHSQIRETRPDLVILDIRLERKDTGWMVLDLLRLDPETRDIPVIICSADAVNLQAKRDMLQQQGYETLEKPFDLEMLLAMVRQKIGSPD